MFLVRVRSQTRFAPNSLSCLNPVKVSARRFRASGQFNNLYPNHIPTSCFQKALLAVGSAVRAYADPTRGEMGKQPVTLLCCKCKEECCKAHQLELLASYPEGTLGRAYADFMLTRGFVSDERSEVKFVDNPDLAYVMTRYRQVHDFWHCLTATDTTVMAEISLKALEFLQTGLPMAALSCIVGPLQLSLAEKIFLVSEVLPWAIKTNNQSEFLLNIYYEQHLEENLEDLRKKFNIFPAPIMPTSHSQENKVRE